MPKNWNLPHLFITVGYSTSPYKSIIKGGASSKGIPRGNRAEHIQKLISQAEAIFQNSEIAAGRKSRSMPAPKGFLLEIETDPSFRFPITQLGTEAIQLRHEREVDGKKFFLVYVPSGEQKNVLKKLTDYKNSLEAEKPNQQAFVESIENLRTAVVESFWTGDAAQIPGNNKVWCEVWLACHPTKRMAIHEFKLVLQNLKKLDIEANAEQLLFFPDRSVFLARLDRPSFELLVESIDEIAEIRLAPEATSFWSKLSRSEQTDVLEELVSRTSFANEIHTSVLVLDTGLAAEHPLFKPFLQENALETVKPEWGIIDRDGHGTEMASISFYGDLQKCLESTATIELTHNLESCKLLPQPGHTNDPELYGFRTQEGIKCLEDKFININRVSVMAVSTQLDSHLGKPSSWSTAVDRLAFSPKEDGNHPPRLLILSAGNIVPWNEEDYIYPESNISFQIENPGQAWNAITVGGFTQKIQISTELNPGLKDYSVVANSGGLSPFSKSALSWQSDWPNKPDCLFEAGNAIKSPMGEIDTCDDVSILVANHNPLGQYLKTTGGTSVAAARCAWACAKLWALYPNAWAETIRGILVHSAEWNQALISQTKTDLRSKGSKSKLLQIAGYGIVNEEKAWRSAQSDFTMVVEREIQPFKKDGSFNEFHLHTLPWPKSTLRDLPGETKIKVRITLSYFIDPAPGEMGFKDKFRYQSHGLRFEMKGVYEDEDTFKERINKIARDEVQDEDEPKAKYDSEPGRWFFGVDNRNRGSIHSDIWIGIVADLAECNLIAVHPVVGWWKQRTHLGKRETKTRYSLIVGLEMEEIINGVDINLYSEVQNEISVSNPVEIKI